MEEEEPAGEVRGGRKARKDTVPQVKAWMVELIEMLLDGIEAEAVCTIDVRLSSLKVP